jgi:pimeloyl-ACP methyl ester carboxylesterase
VPRLVAGLRAEDFLETKAAGIAVPVDLLWGEDDGVLPPDYGRRLASLLPPESRIVFREALVTGPESNRDLRI